MVSAPPPIWHRLGLCIGHATDQAGATGCTVVRGISQPFRCAAALIGRASGSRELATCMPEHLVDRTDAVLLTGGSAYGLDAAAGVMRWMEEHARGFPVGRGVVPIVPTAVIFDLAPLGRFDARPTPDMAYKACATAATMVDEGCVGAGTGAVVGKCAGVEFAMKGGIGIGSAEGGGVLAAAIAVVNAFGDVRDGDGRIIAGARASAGGFVDAERVLRGAATPTDFAFVASDGRQNTTLAVVAVSIPLSKSHLAQVAQAATAAFHRRITPCGTAFDGDILFAVSPLPTDVGSAADTVPLARIEALAVAAIEMAIERGVVTAIGREGIPGLADHPHGDRDV
ncbi:MAG: P1 family peptidase [Gemmatimonadaceae bacterium]|nr:P1 family peptidase [Gemmatimonadaceae bacterium]